MMQRLHLLFLLSLLVSCGNPSKKKASDTVTTATEEANRTKETAIPFPIHNFDGLEPLLHNTDGKTHIVNFWATWCKPCVAELPDFEKTFAEQKENGVAMTLVSLDMPSMWEKRLVPFVKKQALQGEVVILDDPKMNDWIPKIDADWDGGIPATLIYNQNKRQFYPHGLTYGELNKELQKFLN